MKQTFPSFWEPPIQRPCYFILNISVVQFMGLSVDESNWSLQRITVNMPLGKKGIHWMNAELFEDQPQCNISPLPKHLFDVWRVPQTEINQITVLLILTHSHVKLQFCRHVCLYWQYSMSSLVNAHNKLDPCHGNDIFEKKIMWNWNFVLWFLFYGRYMIQSFQQMRVQWICLK